MDPSYLKYISSMGVDPSRYIEMQANYLRLLANCYSSKEKEPDEALLEDSAKKPQKIDIKANESIEEEFPSDFTDTKYQIERKSAYNNDEIPVRPVAVPFEKLLEEEMQKSLNHEQALSESKSKHSFLKRKSQKVIINNQPKELNQDINPEEDQKKNSEESLNEESPRGERESIEEVKVSEVKTQIQQIKQKENKRGRTHAQEDTKPRAEICESPQQAQFLKRGEGKLCIKSRTSASLPRENKLRVSPVVVEELNEEPQLPVESEVKVPVQNKQFLKYQKLLRDLEIKKKNLEKEAVEFYKLRESETQSLEYWKAEELKKIAEEKKRLQKISQENSANPFELEKLKKEVASLKLIIKKNEEKHAKATADLREVIEILSARNKELEKALTEPKIQFDSPRNSDTSVKPKPNPTKSSQNRKEETPKFKKEAPKDLPLYTFKLPDKKTLETRITQKPPVVEIKLEEPKSQGVKEIVEENKTQKIFEDGRKEITFSNGVKKEISPDGYIIVHFNNKDKKETFPDGRTMYHFFENKTVQTTFPDGLQLFQFANGQTEKHFSDGTKEIVFADGTIKCIFNDGQEESIFPDGTVQRIDSSGTKFIEFVNGMKDIIKSDGSKVRQYPDGKIKKVNDIKDSEE